MSYIIIVLTAFAFCAMVNGVFVAPIVEQEWWVLVLFTAFAVLLSLVIDAFFAFLIRRLPEKSFSFGKKIYRCGKREKNFYEKLKIRKWKDKVPELGSFTNFSKNKISDPSNPAYLERYFLEGNYGQAIHFISALFGFAVMAIYPAMPVYFTLGLPIAIVNAVLNMASFFILRYNEYKLEVLYRSVCKKRAMAEKAEPKQEVALSDAR